MTHSNAAHKNALQVIQESVNVLVKWANVEVSPPPEVTNNPIVTRVKEILNWQNQAEIQPLRLLFDNVNLEQSQQKKVHYWQAKSINDRHPKIHYPQSDIPDLEELRGKVADALCKMEGKDWENLSLLMLILEKFGSYISFGGNDIALVDMAKSTAAVAAALAYAPDAEEITLVAGDLSGIQKFIYTIASDGALKSLRARSFYLELVTEEVVQQLLAELKLPRTNVIYAGGCNLYLLAFHDLNRVKAVVNQVCQQFNKWLRNTFDGELFLALDCLPVPTKALGNGEFADYWSKVTKQLTKQKSRKFASDINQFLKSRRSFEPCRVCYRDNLPSLKPLIRLNPDSSLACWVCRTMFELGDNLFDVKAILRSKRANVKGHVDRIPLPNCYYYFFQEWEQAVTAAKNDEIVLSINDWQLEHYNSKHTQPLLLGNYAKRSAEKIEGKKQPGFMSAGEMVGQAEGIPRLGYLRMDVDSLGRIFAEGLKDKKTLPRIAGLSRQISYFFKVYLNSLAEDRKANIPEKIRQLKPEDDRLNLLFIYAGGDDLFISGAWDEVVEFAFDVYQCFRAYTGYNPDITLSGGISIADPKFPLYQAAEESGEAEKAAKGNGKDSLGLFGQVFKWDEWLGVENIKMIDSETTNYLQERKESIPNLLGVFPFVEKLENYQIELNYSRSFVRNLLITADMQEQRLKEFEDRTSNEAQGTRYYLHLPKIAYTLAKLPEKLRKHPEFVEIRKSLMSPYNAPYFRAIATWIELLNREKYARTN